MGHVEEPGVKCVHRYAIASVSIFGADAVGRREAASAVNKRTKQF